GTAQPSPAPVPARSPDHLANVTVIMDGHEKTFGMSAASANIVDAAAEEGLELPYSCKAGVCATGRTWLREGKVRWHAYYGYAQWEVGTGCVLGCRSVPTTDTAVLDYAKV